MSQMGLTAGFAPAREKQSANIGLWLLIVVFGFLPMIVVSASMLMQVLGFIAY